MTKAKDFECLGRTDGIEVTADAEDRGATVFRKGVIDGQTQPSQSMVLRVEIT